MKKTLKLFIVLFAVIFLFGAVLFTAMAADGEGGNEPDQAGEYFFEVFDPTAKTLTKYKDPEQFPKILSSIGSDSVIKLLQNVTVADHCKTDLTSDWVDFSGGKAESPKIYNIDLNGFYFAFIRSYDNGYSVSMNIGSYTTVNIYSSVEGGAMYQYHTRELSTNSLFMMRDSNATLNMGTVTVNDNISYTTQTKNAEKSTDKCDVFDVTATVTERTTVGNNLSVYCAGLIRAEDMTSDDGISININGGSYYDFKSPSVHFIYHQAHTDNAEKVLKIRIKNALIATLDTSSIYTTIRSGEEDAYTYSTGDIEFDNCIIYANSNVIGTYHDEAANTFVIKNSVIAGSVGTIPEQVKLSSCKFSSTASFPYLLDTAKINESNEITLNVNTLSFNDDGTVNESSFALNEKKISVHYGQIIVKEPSEYSFIVWDAEEILGEKVTEQWLNGETPIPSIPIPEATNVYRYAWVKGSTVKNVTTYTLKPYANFGIKANLTLSDSFAFNIYVPADVWASVNSTKIGGAAKEATATAIDGKDYYLISHGINANKAKGSFDFAIELKGYNGTKFTPSYTFSIPDYMDRVQAGGYTEEAKKLIDATENYINAVYNYAEDESNSITQTYTPTKTGDASGLGINVQLLLRESIIFRFTSTVAADMKFFVPAMENGEFVYKTVEKKNATECDVTLPVRFLNEGITVVANGNSGKYYIDDYIRAKASDANADLVALTNAIGTYSATADAYARSEGKQTPVVNYTVAGEKVNKIVANSDKAYEVATRLAEIMSEKGHEIEAVLDTEMKATANAILLSVIAPSREYDYRITVDKTNLVINCSFNSFVSEATDYFITDYVKYADKNVNFASDFTKNYNTSKIYYEDFGAVGNAASNDINDRESYIDDFFAIKATHDFANETKRHTVYAKDDATYYIHETRALNEEGVYGSVQTIKIKTDVNWGNAKFIIDDTNMGSSDGTGRSSKRIFEVASDYASTTISNADILENIGSIGEGTTKINLELGYDALIAVYNSDHMVYRRKGYSSEGGEAQHELLVIDGEGYIDESTPFMFDYDRVTKVVVYRIDEQPTTVSGGTFYTWASRLNIYQPVYANKQAFDPATGSLLWKKDENGKTTNTPLASEHSGYVHKYRTGTEKNYKYQYGLESPGNEWTDLGVFLKTINSGYISRGINVSRSNTTLEGVQHYIKYEISVAEQNAGTNYKATETIVDDETGETVIQDIPGSEIQIAFGGAPYQGFFYATSATDVTFKNCVLTGRRGYQKVSNSDDSGMTGTYDFGGNLANNFVVDGCLQSNFYMNYASSNPGMVTSEPIIENGKIVGFNTVDGGTTKPGYTVTYNGDIPVVKPADGSLLSMSKPNATHGGRMCWGIGGTNYCKNMAYKNSVMSRFDAHCGLLNGEVTGTTINFFAMVGKGEFLIEDVTWITSALEADDETNNSLIFLRNDYGSPWDGTITIKDTVAQGYESGKTWLIYHIYNNWDYGYTAHFPNIIVNNLEFTNTKNVTFLYSNWTDDIHLETYKNETNLNTVVPPEFIKIINNKENYIMPKDKGVGTNFFSSTYIAVDTNGDEKPDEIQNPGSQETPVLPIYD